MHPALNIAIKAARRAGQIINRASNDLDLLKVETKQPNDFVTEVDRKAEAAIIETLREAYPQYGILAEESGETSAQGSGDAEYQWIIDPLDGTTNFIHGLPQYAVSIALAKGGSLEQAVIFDPNRNELFTASKGGGAFLNERRIRVSKRSKLQDSLIGTGFPYRMFEHIDTYLAIFKELAQKTSGQRRPGAASLDLAYVACGRYDGFWEFGLAPWDMAAGALLISEAGGLVSDMRGEATYLASGNVTRSSMSAIPNAYQRTCQPGRTRVRLDRGARARNRRPPGQIRRAPPQPGLRRPRPRRRRRCPRRRGPRSQRRWQGGEPTRWTRRAVSRPGQAESPPRTRLGPKRRTAAGWRPSAARWQIPPDGGLAGDRWSSDLVQAAC